MRRHGQALRYLTPLLATWVASPWLIGQQASPAQPTAKNSITHPEPSNNQSTVERIRAAENVKWIGDNNPGAKMVLWAANGHVQYQWRRWHPIGQYPPEFFPGQLVNFGFPFNQGSFRVMEMGKGLREFTVTAAPEGSLEQTLAAAGMPVLTLDLGKLPKPGPVANWFDQAHVSRRIGAIYSEAGVASYFLSARPQDEFDTLVFVNKTNAARGN